MEALSASKKMGNNIYDNYEIYSSVKFINTFNLL
jgi:hypothetical protein